MVIGFAWYGPLFGKEWMKLVGMTKDHMDKMSKDKDAMMKTYGASFVSSLLMAYALAHFIWFTAPGSTTMLVGVKTAIWAWVGFILPYALSKAIYAVDKKPMKLFWIDTG